MIKRLILLFVLFALAGSVLAGTPLHDPNAGMMECCKRAKSKDHSPVAEAARLCCAVNCTESVPTPSGISFNFSPSNTTTSKTIADQIAALFTKVKVVPVSSPNYSREILSRTFQPRYIQYNSFLI